MAIGALDVACLDPSGGDFKHVVEPLVEGAMRLLESTKSRDVLTKYGATLLDLQEAKPSKQMKYNHKAADSDKVSTYLQVFLDKVRSSFPKIYLERMAADGVASRRDWGGELMDYDPKLAGHITLDYVVSSSSTRPLPLPWPRGYHFPFSLYTSLAELSNSSRPSPTWSTPKKSA